jgi:hypothetical protein
VYNPVVGGPDTVKNLESSVNTHYDTLFLTVDKRFANHYQMHAAYTPSKSPNYANDDQIPFGNGPIDPLDLHREYGPTPNDQRNRFVISGTADPKWGFQTSPLWTLASSVPMDIMLPDNNTRIPQFQRNAGCRVFHKGRNVTRPSRRSMPSALRAERRCRWLTPTRPSATCSTRSTCDLPTSSTSASGRHCC